jgi:hypothetical protein
MLVLISNDDKYVAISLKVLDFCDELLNKEKMNIEYVVDMDHVLSRTDKSYIIFNYINEDKPKYRCVPINVYFFDNGNVVEINDSSIEFNNDNYVLKACYLYDNISLIYGNKYQLLEVPWCNGPNLKLNTFYPDGIMN